MAGVRFVDKDTLYASERSAAQQVNYPVATVVYATSTKLPVKLPKNVLLYTTDTRELYIGTGDRIVRVNIGSDGEVVSLADYLTETQLGNTYTKLESFDPVKDKVDELDIQLGGLQDSIEAFNIQLSNKVNDDDIYTVKEMQDTFVKGEDLTENLENKVTVRIQDKGNDSYHINTKDGTITQFFNGQTKITSKINVHKDNVIIQAFNNTNSGSNLIIKPTGIFYTEDQEIPKAKNELATQDDIDALQRMYSDLESRMEGIESYCETVQSKVESFEENLARIIQTLETNDNDIGEIRDIATHADNLASVTSNNYDELHITVGDINSSLQTVANTAQAAYTEASWGSDAVALYKIENNARIVTLEQKLNRYMRTQIIYSVLDNPAVKTITDIVPGYYVNNSEHILEIPYGTQDINSKVTNADADEVLVAVKTDNNVPLTVSAGITWNFDMYNPYNYQITVAYSGTLNETEDLKLSAGSNLKPQILVKVKPPDSILPEQIDSDGWIEYFVMPINSYMIEDFAVSFLKKSFDAEDIMGVDQEGNTVTRTIRLDLVGALNDRDVDQTSPVLKTYTELTRTVDVLDSKFIAKYPEGLEVPVRLNNEDTFTEYETQCYHTGAFVSNGAFWYNQDSDCLVFDTRSAVNLVYKIYTISRSKSAGSGGGA